MKETSRGFGLIEFVDTHNSECSIQESSSADEACIWLGLSEAEPLILHGEATRLGIDHNATCGWVKYHIPDSVLINTRMHLNQEQARALANDLIFFAENGYLKG